MSHTVSGLCSSFPFCPVCCERLRRYCTLQEAPFWALPPTTPPRHHATMPSPRDTAPGATFIKWTAKSNKLGEKHFWTPRIWNQSGGDVTGGEVRRQEKNNKALFFPSPPLASPRVPLCPNPLCRPAGKGRPAAKAGAAGKMWRLPSGSGGGGVAHSFVLPEASIQTRLYGQTGPAPGRSPAPSLTLSLSLSLLCLYTLTPGLSLCHTHTHTHTHTPLAHSVRHRANHFLPNIRQLPWQQGERGEQNIGASQQ